MGKLKNLEIERQEALNNPRPEPMLSVRVEKSGETNMGQEVKETKLSKFVCSKCEGTFVTETTDEECEEAALSNFGEAFLTEPENFGAVCGECYQKYLTENIKAFNEAHPQNRTVN